MTILPRETKNGTVYFIRVSLGYINGKQQTKGMTYKPETRKRNEPACNRKGAEQTGGLV